MNASIKPLTTSVLLALVVLAGCGERTNSTSDQRVERQQMTDAEQQLATKAQQACQQLGGTLKAKLLETVASEGPAAAIGVCSEQAPAIAQQVSQELDLRVGRTSFKRRNPANTPPAWAESYIDDRVDQTVFLRTATGLRMLQPIHMDTPCLMCHGDQAAMLPEVTAAIASRYPQDQARGFGEGDLRGWFWVEVDATAGE